MQKQYVLIGCTLMITFLYRVEYAMGMSESERFAFSVFARDAASAAFVGSRYLL